MELKGEKLISQSFYILNFMLPFFDIFNTSLYEAMCIRFPCNSASYTSSHFPMRWMGLVTGQCASMLAASAGGGGGGGEVMLSGINEPVDQKRPLDW